MASGRRPRWLWHHLSTLRLDLPLAVVDAMLVVGSYMSLLAIRFDGAIPSGYSNRLFGFIPVVVVITLAANFVCGLYGQVWLHASVAEARRVLLAGLLAGAVVFVVNPLIDFPLPRSVAISGAIVATLFMGLVRFQSRLFGWRRRIDREAARVVVVGAGSAGAAIVKELRARDSGIVPVVVVDDDPRKQGRDLQGVRVIGDTSRIEEIVEEFDVEEVLVAMPSADQSLMRTISLAAEQARVPIKVLPPTRQLLGLGPLVRQARDLQIDDLLGRHQVTTDLESVSAAVKGRRVLVTGAGGSIGSEIAIQVADFEPAQLVLLDHDETHLYDLVAQLPQGVEVEQVLTDIRDAERISELFARTSPEIVFHAAAHKHVPLLEAHPVEAVQTNVLGTRNVVRAATEAETDRLVFISTDKAVRPQNVLGRSKWLGERIVSDACPKGASWCSVRFGNVVGSRGSVVPTFAGQIAAGGPVTVTDPRMTRYFISVQEAVQLVLQASVLSTGREVYMLDMGRPVNILELAERMIRLSGHVVGSEVAVTFVGARPGEKLSEELQAPDESCAATAHPAIVALTSDSADVAGRVEDAVDVLDALVSQGRDEAAQRLLVDLTNAAADGGRLTREPTRQARSLT